jgi:hypothetical protein
MDVVRWYEEWDGTLTPDYNNVAVRGVTIEYNQVKADAKKPAEIAALDRMEVLAHGCWERFAQSLDHWTNQIPGPQLCFCLSA